MNATAKHDDEFVDIDDTGDPNAPAQDGDAAGGGYAWEEEYKRSWDIIQEDEQGSLASAVSSLQQQRKRRRRLRDTASVQRGIIRHLFIVLDASLAMNEKDLRPNRMELVVSQVEAYVHEYFDQNPLSQLGLLITRDSLAEKISELSGNPMDHIRALQLKRLVTTGGEPSLQNALELATQSLQHAPAHGTREILFIFGSLTTCDPGNIRLTLEAAKAKHVQCSMVHLGAEVKLFRDLCDQTKGTFGVAMNEAHFKDLLFETVPPPPLAGRNKAADLILMGFPMRIIQPAPTFCVWCQCKVCNLPTNCDICNLTLVASPHLARSYHHLFPVQNFKELMATR
ncbi:hypothetical protein IWQ61_006072, partial [Dispira simplex]